MNRYFILFVLFFDVGLAGGLGCGQNPGTQDRQMRAAAETSAVDSLKAIINALKPGLGEFMIQLKYHHDRLGEAISAKDYERAAYETDEMKETAEKIVQLHITNDKLQQPFTTFYGLYLQTPLAVLKDAASKRDGAALHRNFITLTANCNSCHHANSMPFLKIE